MSHQQGHCTVAPAAEHVDRRGFLVRTTSLLFASTAIAAVLDGRGSRALAATQNDWAHCTECNQLFFNGDPRNKGRCAAFPFERKPHKAEGGPDRTLRYELTHDAPGAGQDQWRFCRKCSVLFFNGSPSKGVCAADHGAHEAAGFNFFLAHDRPPRDRDEEQGGWQFCAKCNALFHAVDPKASRLGCPADNKGHQAEGFLFVVVRHGVAIDPG